MQSTFEKEQIESRKKVSRSVISWSKNLKAARYATKDRITYKQVYSGHEREVISGFNNPFRIPTWLIMISIAFSIMIFSAPTTLAAANNKAFIYAKSATAAPPGAQHLCTRYKWACTRSGKPRANSTVALKIAKLVNNQVNRQTRQVEDQRQYGKEEYWTLPSSRGGDCEDIVLLKKKRLMNKGLSSNNLLIATVLDLNRNSHAVLVLRTKRGDYVLDSFRNRIVPWFNTGYTFLKMQNPKSPRRWNAILAGGLIADTPTGAN